MPILKEMRGTQSRFFKNQIVRSDHLLQFADPLPEKYLLAPGGLPDVAVNVASLYVQFVRDMAEATALAPVFEAAFRRHRLIDAIERANAEGRHVQL